MTMNSAAPGSASAPDARGVPRQVEVASWLLYGAAAMIAVVAVWTLIDLPGALNAVPDTSPAGARIFYAVTLLIPVAALHFFAARWAVAGKIPGLVVGTLLGLIMGLGSYTRSVFGPLPEDGEPLSGLTQATGTVWLLAGLGTVGLLWVPPSFRFFRQRRRERRAAEE